MKIDCNVNMIKSIRLLCTEYHVFSNCIFLFGNVSIGNANEVTLKVYSYYNVLHMYNICFTYSIMAIFSLSENLTVGHSCSYSRQCTGTEFANVCNNRRCECQSGYILNYSNCYLGN